MKETIRCCLSCIFPCGAFDVIRIVHASGRVDELPGPATAGDITKAYPKHVLKKQPASYDAIGGRALVLPSNAELQRGKIYFLVPLQICSSKKEKKKRNCEGDKKRAEIGMEKKREMESSERRRSRVGWRPKLERIQEFDD